MRLIERGGPLSLSRQCALLGVSRSSQYYRPKGERAENLALMRRLDELHMAYPFYGSRQLMRHLRREGITAGRHRIRRLMRLMGMEATYRRPRTSVASPQHRTPSFPNRAEAPILGAWTLHAASEARNASWRSSPFRSGAFPRTPWPVSRRRSFLPTSDQAPFASVLVDLVGQDENGKSVIAAKDKAAVHTEH